MSDKISDWSYDRGEDQKQQNPTGKLPYSPRANGKQTQTCRKNERSYWISGGAENRHITCNQYELLKDLLFTKLNDWFDVCEFRDISLQLLGIWAKRFEKRLH